MADRQLKPTMGEIIDHASAFDRYCIHLECSGASGPLSHALLSWEPGALSQWAERASACFPDLSFPRLLAMRTSHATESDSLLARLAELHGIDEPMPELTEDDFVDSGGDFWRSERQPRRLFHCSELFPSSISNPSTHMRIRVSHQTIFCASLNASGSLCSQAFSDELLSCWGPARVALLEASPLRWPSNIQARDMRSDPAFQAALAAACDASDITGMLRSTGSSPSPSAAGAPRI